MTDPVSARELDERILGHIQQWHRSGAAISDDVFEQLALDLFAFQVAHNRPYARFAEALGVTPKCRMLSWHEIPAVPASAFKDATLATFEVRWAEAEFHTSGTTADRAGKHYLERAAIYDAALSAGFDRFMLADRPKIRFLNVVPDPRTRPHSSLGYMMGTVSVLRGDGHAGWFLQDDTVDAAGFAAALRAAIENQVPVCVAGTAFAFVALLDALDCTGERFAAPAGSRIMETGGFKGRAHAVKRHELYARLEQRFGVAYDRIVAEYGMTELTSQYYDLPQSRGALLRVKGGPPWLRTCVVDAGGQSVALGETGFLRHVDLANRSSVIAVDTEDRGYAVDGGFVLLGRGIDAPPRGCSLDAEELLA